MKEVRITDEMRALASILGAMRSLNAKANGIRDAKMGKQNGVDGDQLGILGELAFCQMHNVWPDIGLTPRAGSADAVVKGYRWDVKSTSVPSGRLLATLKENPDVDAYALAIVDGEKVTFPGWAWKSDLINQDRVGDLGHGKGYVMQQQDLRPWK